MDDNNDNENNNKENNKCKKIRKLLLLQTDKELKTKKKSDFRINTKTIQELNKSYDLYNIPLSEKSRIYFNYVKTGEKIYPNNIRPIDSNKIISARKKKEQPVKIINNTSTIEEDYSNVPINYIPKKIDLGIKKIINTPRRRSKNFTKLPKFFDNLHLDNTFTNREELNRSTKIEQRGIYKIVDKIVNIKMGEDIEDLVKKNIIKLRKYCCKFRKIKKKAKRLKTKQKDRALSPRKSKEKNGQRKKFSKKMTIREDKQYLKKSLFVTGDRNTDFLKRRVNLRMKTTKALHVTIIENEKSQKDKNKNTKIMGSTKIIKNIRSPKIIEYKSQRKLKIRKMQSLTNIGNGKNKIFDNRGTKTFKHSESNKCESMISTFSILYSAYNNYNPPIKEMKNSKFKPSFNKNNNNNINSRKSLNPPNFSNEKKDTFRRSQKKNKKSSIKINERYIDLN